MKIIIDCYTDEPSGLGVPPYIGTYPRYIAGALVKHGVKEEDIKYLTIDDMRLWHFYNGKIPETKISDKTNIKIYNLSANHKEVPRILRQAEELIVIAGVHTPGKYLSAVPATLPEITSLIKNVKARKILTGPAGSKQGSRLEGGKKAETFNSEIYNEIAFNYLGIEEGFEQTSELAVKGAFIIRQHPQFPDSMIEIETGRGCASHGKCWFCVEPGKIVLFREVNDIIEEVKTLYDMGARHFRLGKQTCFYSYKNRNVKEIRRMLKGIRDLCPEIKTLHIDNVDPSVVAKYPESKEITKLIVEYCTDGNVAAFGVESFDEDVCIANNLNSRPELTMKAIRLINEYGAERGKSGLPKFIPGINIIFGLNKETSRTNEINMEYLRKILSENLLLRRINIRQVTLLADTILTKVVGARFLRKNKKLYWRWRNEIRQNIDLPMLKKIVPEGTVLRNVKLEIYNGKTTFGRQLGTYPLVVGIPGRHKLGKFVDVKIKKHMIRSVTAEIFKKELQTVRA